MSLEPERDTMNRLCRLILAEKDPQTFAQLTRELDELLEANHNRHHSEQKSRPEAA